MYINFFFNCKYEIFSKHNTDKISECFFYLLIFLWTAPSPSLFLCPKFGKSKFREINTTSQTLQQIQHMNNFLRPTYDEHSTTLDTKLTVTK